MFMHPFVQHPGMMDSIAGQKDQRVLVEISSEAYGDGGVGESLVANESKLMKVEIFYHLYPKKETKSHRWGGS